MIEFLSYVYLVGTILILVFLNFTNAVMTPSGKEFALILVGTIFWPITAVYLIVKTIIRFSFFKEVKND